MSAVIPLVNPIRYTHFAASALSAQPANSAHSPADQHGAAAVAELLIRSAVASCAWAVFYRLSGTNSEERAPPTHPPPNRPPLVLQGWGLQHPVILDNNSVRARSAADEEYIVSGNRRRVGAQGR